MYITLRSSNGGRARQLPFELSSYINEIDTDVIVTYYMNSKFTKYLKSISLSSQEVDKALNELYKTFATLTQEEQKYATIFLHDIQSGLVIIDKQKTLRDYINEYQEKAQYDQIKEIANALGLDESKLRKLMSLKVTDKNINEYGRFDELKNTIDKAKARVFVEKLEGEKVKPFQVMMKIDKLLRNFICQEGFEIELSPREQ